MQVAKPPHNRYILSCMDECTYIKYADAYSCCKRWGVRGIYAFLTGTELYGVAKEALLPVIWEQSGHAGQSPLFPVDEGALVDMPTMTPP